MPFDSFNIHSNSRSSSSQQNALPGNSTSGGILQAAANLGSFGMPSLSSSATGQSAPPPTTYGLPHPNSSMTTTSNNTSMNQQSQQYETPRRARHADELHSNMSAQRGTLSPRDYGASGPRMTLDQAAPDSSQYSNAAPLPGALQPGRPGVTSTNTAPSIPTISQDQYSTPSRSAGHSHNYTRSSPAAGFDSQGFATFQTTTPGGSEQNTQKYTPQGSQRTVSNAPLGLADIRPRTDSTLAEGLPGPIHIHMMVPAQHPPTATISRRGLYMHSTGIQILDSHIVPTQSESYVPGAPKYGLEFTKVAEATHSYPVTRLLWEPPSSQKQSTDLLATSGDHLRLWSLPSETPVATASNTIGGRSSNSGRDLPPSKLTPLALLSNSKTPEHTAPLTSLDWNTVSPSLIITSSIDTTCTIWDIPTLTAKTQLIAHDKEVFDVRFCANSVDVFYSSPGGGRISPTLAQQTMSYAPPLLRLAASPHDTHLLATFSQDSNIIRILDVRQPGQALLELQGHSSSINCIEWSPNRRGTLASGADDSLVLIWDLLSQNTAPPVGPSMNGAPASDNSRGPTASWQCDYEVGNISWAPRSNLNNNENGDWLGVSGGRGIWGVKL
ncbi:WD repeat domain-containing protein [Botrytis cinerea]